MYNDIELTIIVPTRNRPDYIPIGIGSIVKQFADLPIRVIITDNSDPVDAKLNSTYIKSLNNRHLAYIRPPETLSMVNHWNWAVEYVLYNTSSTHFTILTDRGFYRHGALCDLIARIRDYDKDIISFVGDTILDFYPPIVIGENSWTGRVEIINCETLLSDASHCNFSRALPKVLNSIIPSPLAREMKERSSSIFPPTLSPDYGIAFEFLVTLERIIFYDKPLTVGFGLRRSNGANLGTGSLDERTVRDFLNLNQKSNGGSILRVPVPEIVNSSNAIVHEYLSARIRHPDKNVPEISLDAYHHFLFKSLGSISNRHLRTKYKRLLSAHGFTQRPHDLLLECFYRLRSKLHKGGVRSFTSTTDAIRYAYENYPPQVTK